MKIYSGLFRRLAPYYCLIFSYITQTGNVKMNKKVVKYSYREDKDIRDK